MRLLFPIAALSALIALPASAVTVLQYGTEGSTTAMAPSFEATGVSGNDFTAGTGILVNNFSTFNFDSWDTDNVSAADAIADDEVWSWGFTSTQAWDLTDFSIRLDRSGTGPDDFVIELAVNGGGFTEVLSHDFADATTGVTFSNVDLSAFTNVSSAIFRLAAFNSEGSLGTFDLESFDGETAFSLTGELGGITPVPLPAGLPLMLTGLGALALRRRRKA